MSEQRTGPVVQDGNWTFQPHTELAKEMWEIRKRIVASGVPLLDDVELEREIASRRGGVGYSDDENNLP